MLYTVRNVYIQPSPTPPPALSSNRIVLNIVGSSPTINKQIIYFQTPQLPPVSFSLLRAHPSAQIAPTYFIASPAPNVTPRLSHQNGAPSADPSSPIRLKTCSIDRLQQQKSSSYSTFSKAQAPRPIQKPPPPPPPVTRNDESVPLSAEEQLESNLARFGYRRQLVEADGNCFFTAVASELLSLFNNDRYLCLLIKQRINLDDNTLDSVPQLSRFLRKLVCLEWKIHEHKYKPYIPVIDNENRVNYYDEIRKFRADKFYSSTLGDVLPLTISNLTGMRMKIITNLAECPVLDVCPQDEPLLMSLATNNVPTLTLAYNQENDGHYDIAREKT